MPSGKWQSEKAEFQFEAISNHQSTKYSMNTTFNLQLSTFNLYHQFLKKNIFYFQKSLIFATAKHGGYSSVG